MPRKAQDSKNSPRELPAVYQVLDHPILAALQDRIGHAYLTDEVRGRIEAHRQALTEGAKVPDLEAIAQEVADRVVQWLEPKLKPVINLTGTLVHTNLGRAPLSEAAVKAAMEAANATNLEYDLDKGKRGDRDDLVEELLCRLTGAEAATVVNNNAAAVYLVLNTLADKKRIAVGRGELVEIGDSFRIPDIVRKSGAKLMEVGTTNRTHLKDYRQAIEDGARVLLKVHTSNYRIEGFVHEVDFDELAALGHERDIPTVADLGSGALLGVAHWGLSGEPVVRDVVASGIDLITFSGDKLIGGPQTGLIVGRRDWVKKVKRNPMKRALRCDKLRLAALGATLGAFLSPETIDKTLPVYHLIARTLPEIEALAAEIMPAVERWAGNRAEVETVSGDSQVGSGSLPGATLPTVLVALTPKNSNIKALAKALRDLRLPVIGRVHGGKVLLDMRCLLDTEALLGSLQMDKGANS
ncbi:MAG: L-seryl-tRNA(Sec) selenium transferase [Rhodospirillales bacterium]|nr:L-seryl-tRNA(Sec) selenium transferase [Rhodospirillales bacterium]